MQSQTHLTLAAYERWAATYSPAPHNPLMRAEQQAMLGQWPWVAGRHALDLACGSGRYAKLLADAGAASVTALDFSAAMLRRVSDGQRVQASMMSLPFASGVFDIVVSGLAVGHASSLQQWMTEVARVLNHAGVLLYSDFHPQAARAGLPRSFKDEHGQRYTVPHNSYEVGAQTDAAAAAGLVVESVHELRVGMEVCEPFSGSESFYQQWHGLPLVLIVRARKD
jgi:ubiquinone/menaquinone biosynthesis C-methylase UbiE